MPSRKDRNKDHHECCICKECFYDMPWIFVPMEDLLLKDIDGSVLDYISTEGIKFPIIEPINRPKHN
ncbi:MAG TPA: hypothetical protein EYN67_16310 [Flavobacteriales bacterium]|nr:hypothetical protein [Flavobacteriales bacterium]